MGRRFDDVTQRFDHRRLRGELVGVAGDGCGDIGAYRRLYRDTPHPHLCFLIFRFISLSTDRFAARESRNRQGLAAKRRCCRYPL